MRKREPKESKEALHRRLWRERYPRTGLNPRKVLTDEEFFKNYAKMRLKQGLE